jgi:hypothetical protein
MSSLYNQRLQFNDGGFAYGCAQASLPGSFSRASRIIVPGEN